jgi:hypothetical protein
MLSYLTDEDMRGAIIDGLRLHHPGVKVLRAIEVGLSGRDDDEVLAWAAANGRVTVSHDVNTMIEAVNMRLAAGHAMSGLIVVPQSLGTGQVIADLAFVATVSTEAEMKDATVWLPL